MKEEPSSTRTEYLLLHLTINWPIAVGLVMACALVAGLIGLALPTDFTASARVLVDHNVAEALDTSNRQAEATYLSRETVRLEGIGYADEVWAMVREEMEERGWDNLPDANEDLFSYVRIPHPMDGVWQFTVTHPDQAFASDLASAWASAFTATVRAGLGDALQMLTAQQELDNLQERIHTEEEQLLIARAAQDAIAEHDLLNPDSAPLEERSAVLEDILLGLELLDEEPPAIPGYASGEELTSAVQDLFTWLDMRLSTGDAYLSSLQEDEDRLQEDLLTLALSSGGISPYLEVELLQDSIDVDKTVENTGWMAVFGALVGVLLYVGWWAREQGKAGFGGDGMDADGS